MTTPTEGAQMCAPTAAALRAELAARILDLHALGEADHSKRVFYLWAGAVALELGVDCTGLICVEARELSTPLPLGRPDTDTLWRKCEHVLVPEPGDLALYGNGPADPTDPACHVMVVLPGGRVGGMSGGGRKTTSRAIAERFDARLKVFDDSPRYRKDRIGYVRLPFHLAPGVEEV